MFLFLFPTVMSIVLRLCRSVVTCDKFRRFADRPGPVLSGFTIEPVTSLLLHIDIRTETQLGGVV